MRNCDCQLVACKTRETSLDRDKETKRAPHGGCAGNTTTTTLLPEAAARGAVTSLVLRATERLERPKGTPESVANVLPCSQKSNPWYRGPEKISFVESLGGMFPFSAA